MHPENEEKSIREGTNEDRHIRLQYRYQSHSAMSLENPRQRLKDLEHIGPATHLRLDNFGRREPC